jgi:hypothetical protein
MTKLPDGWKISKRDNEKHQFDWQENNKHDLKNRTPEEIEKDKQDIIARHQRLGLNENLKKELYPNLFS